MQANYRVYSRLKNGTRYHVRGLHRRGTLEEGNAKLKRIVADLSLDQIWFKSNLLFRMLRDAGMSHFGLPVLELSKEALCKADCCARECGCHCSRLANPFFRSQTLA